MTVAVRLVGADRLPLADYAESRWDTHTWREIAEGARYDLFGGEWEPTEGQVKSAHRDRAKLRAKFCNGHAPATREGTEDVQRDETQSQVSHESTRDTIRIHVGEAWADDTPSTDAKRRALTAYLRTTWDDTRVPLPAPAETRLVCGIGDLHGDPDPLITAALIKAQPDVIVVSGDMTDQQQAGRHGSETKDEARRRRQRAFQDEMTNVRAWLETLLDQTSARLMIFRGNHDQWAFKRARDLLPDWMLDYFNDPLDVLTDALGDRVTIVGQPVIYHHPNGTQQRGGDNEFMFVYGDVLFSHMNYTQSVTETAVSKLHRQWFAKWRRTMGLDHVRVLVQFHSHGRALRSVEGGHMLLVEPGMGGNATVEAYKVSYNTKWGPGIQGFAQIAQHWHKTAQEWRTDFGSVQLVAPRVARGG